MNYPFGRKIPVRPLLVSLALLIGAFATSCGGTAAEQGTEQPAKPQSGGDGEQASVDLEHPTLGDEGAPVVLTEYADYQ